MMENLLEVERFVPCHTYIFFKKKTASDFFAVSLKLVIFLQCSFLLDPKFPENVKKKFQGICETLLK